MGALRIKRRLSNISANSWHYRLATAANDSLKYRKVKACKYYWWILPSSVVKLAVIYLIGAIIIGGGWLLGYHYKPESDSGEEESYNREENLFYPKKQKRDGTRNRIDPWQLILVGL